MTEFAKRRATRISLVLESIETERNSLFNSVPGLLSALTFVFALLTFIRIGILIDDFGLMPLFDYRQPLMIALTSVLFVISFAFATACSFVLTLSISSALGFSLPPQATVTSFAGLTAFILSSLWESNLAWFFGGYLSTPIAFVVVVIASMSIATLWPSQNYTRTKTNALQIKHLFAATAVVAILLVSTQVLLEQKSAILTFQRAAVYAALQIIILFATSRLKTVRPQC